MQPNAYSSCAEDDYYQFREDLEQCPACPAKRLLLAIEKKYGVETAQVFYKDNLPDRLKRDKTLSFKALGKFLDTETLAPFIRSQKFGRREFMGKVLTGTVVPIWLASCLFIGKEAGADFLGIAPLNFNKKAIDLEIGDTKIFLTNRDIFHIWSISGLAELGVRGITKPDRKAQEELKKINTTLDNELNEAQLFLKYANSLLIEILSRMKKEPELLR